MRIKTAAGMRRGISFFLCAVMLVSTVCAAGMLTLPVAAADTAAVPGVQFTVTENADNAVTLSMELRGASLARTQCAALAYDRDVLTLVSQDGSADETSLAPAADTLSLLGEGYVGYAAGWNAGEIGCEYGRTADGMGLLVLYAEAETAVSLADYTTVATLTFTKNEGAELSADTLRLWNYEEQRTYGQSVKLLVCTPTAHATFGALAGGDTLTEPKFCGNAAISGNRGEDVLVEEETWVNRFSDVADNAPYYDAIAYVCKNNLFLGSSETTFDPDNAMTRATFATVLCRLAGAEAAVLAAGAGTESPFTDVKIGEWYTPYVLWAYENGIFLGRGDGTFGPTTEITHEQMYLVIRRFTEDHNYHTKDGTNVSVSSVADADRISDWALEAVRFAFANGLLIADTNRCIRPTEAAARWELAVLLESLASMVRTETGDAALQTVMAASVLDTYPAASDAMLQGAKQKIYEGLLTLSAEIDISAFSLNRDQMYAVYQETAKQAELFYVGNPFRYQYDRSTGMILAIIPEYTMTGAELIAAQNVYREKMGEILSGVDKSWSDFEKILYLHDYLATHFVYDMELGQYDTYTFLVKGRGVCQSYTLVMSALLTTLGIESSRVTSVEMNHTWNLVKLDGKWYHLDVTWDDPFPNQWGQVQHTYFLKSDAYMKAHEHANWDGFEKRTCTDTRYDKADFNTVRTPFVPWRDGYWYYFENETSTLYRRDFDAGKKEKVMTCDARWYADDEKKLYYQSMYTGLIAYGDVLIYNSEREIYAYHPNSGMTEVIGYADANIYGVMLELGEDAAYAVYEMKTDVSAKTGTYGRVRLGQVFTYSVTGAVRGYFTDKQVKLSLLRNGAVYRSVTAARSGIYLETEYAFSFDGVKPGRYDLLVEKNGAFAYTVKNIDVGSDTDVSFLLGFALPLIAGDLNADGIIDDADVTLLVDRNTFRRPTAEAVVTAADLNGDGMIDITDYAILTDGDTFGKKKEDCTVKVA